MAFTVHSFTYFISFSFVDSVLSVTTLKLFVADDCSVCLCMHWLLQRQIQQI